MSYHLKARKDTDNASPADKFEGRMLENSLASKVNNLYEIRDCCNSNLIDDIEKIQKGNFHHESKIAAINEHLRGAKPKPKETNIYETKEMKKMTLNINSLITGNFGDPVDLRSKTNKMVSPRRMANSKFKQIQMFDTEASQKDEYQSQYKDSPKP